MSMSYPAKFIPLANKEDLLKEYLGKRKSELPTPCFIVNRKVAASNCKKMLENANSINATFRAHVKTHKTLEGTILQLGEGENKTNKLIVSTLMEAWHLLPLVEQGLANDILFSLPVIESRLNEITLMIMKYPKLELRLMLDNYEQLEILSKYSEEHNITKKWSVFVKINMGTNRAGLENEDNVLNKLIQQLATPNSTAAKYISLYGFYCHAGHAYGSKSIHQARSLLIQEVESANLACQKAIEINSSLKLVISVGSTPTAHSTSTSIAVLEEIEGLGKLYGTLEIHAGNYPFCDLQQVGTNCIGLDSVSCKVLADVLSAYPGRGSKLPGEQLINAGVLAMSRETGPLPGFGNISSPEGYGDWIIGRLSQEHGILIPKNDQCKLIPLGKRVEIVPQHSCITAASYPWYYIFDGDSADDTVVDIWIPFRGW